MRGEGFIREMKGAGFHGLVILVVLILFSSQLLAFPISTRGSLNKVIQNRAPQEQSKEIRVQIQEGTLCQALKDLEKKAQGLFACPKVPGPVKVYSRTIRGITWQSIVTQLLSDYNTVVLWKNDKELESIYLLGLNSAAVSAPHFTRAPDKERDLLSDIAKLRTHWTNAPLSEELFNHPGFQKIFKAAQINSPEDWMVQKKQFRVKNELRKLYKTTQQKRKAPTEKKLVE